MAAFLFTLSAILDAGVALLHVILIFFGARAYRAFGAGETLARMVERGSPVPAILTLGIAAVFAAFAAFCLAAGGWFSIPYTRLAVTGITLLYVLRSALLGAWLFVPDRFSRFDLVSSVIALAIGFVHAAALWAGVSS
jgi:hypothetical protein